MLVLIALLILAGLAIAWLWQSHKGDKVLITAMTSQLIAKDKMLAKFQEADNVANEQKDKMASGTTGDRVNASVDVLHDIAARSRKG